MGKALKMFVIILAGAVMVPGSTVAQNQNKSPSAASLIKPAPSVPPRCVYDNSFQHVYHSYDGAEAEKKVMEKPLECTVGTFMGAASTPYCEKGVTGLWKCYRLVTCHRPIPKCSTPSSATASKQ